MKIARANLRNEKESIKLLTIRNLDEIRIWTNNPDKIIGVEEHLYYVKTQLGLIPSEDRLIVFFVLDENENIVGYQRFDQASESPNTWCVSTALNPDFHGKGFGTSSLMASIEQLKINLEDESRHLISIEAWIHEGNIPSEKMFSHCNFKDSLHYKLDKTGRVMKLYTLDVLN